MGIKCQIKMKSISLTDRFHYHQEVMKQVYGLWATIWSSEVSSWLWVMSLKLYDKPEHLLRNVRGCCKERSVAERMFSIEFDTTETLIFNLRSAVYRLAFASLIGRHLNQQTKKWVLIRFIYITDSEVSGRCWRLSQIWVKRVGMFLVVC